MQRKLAALPLCLVFLSAAIYTNGQQKAPAEFISPIGQFGVMLPPSSVDYFQYQSFNLEATRLVGWVYNWRLDSDEAVIIHAMGQVDLEPNAEFYLELIRDKYAPGSIINQKKTSFAGHPGLISLVDTKSLTGTTRAMVWTYLLNNRVYLMSVTLDNKAKTEEHIKLMSTFRILSPKDMESRLAELIEGLTPESLPPGPAQARPTSDADDAALKGRVKTVIAETEPYVDGSLFGLRQTVSTANYDEQGNIIKTIDYRDSLPFKVRLYGTNKGERAFREMRRTRVNLKDKRGSDTTEPKPEAKLYTIKYKHDSEGRLVEMRVLRDGKEVETAKYNLKAKTVERRYETEFEPARIPPSDLKSVVDSILSGAASVNVKSKDVVSTLDSNGNSIEDAYQVVKGSFSRPGFDGEKRYPIYRTDKVRYEYKLDDHGNWIERKTLAFMKDKETVPMEVTYRTITYFQ